LALLAHLPGAPGVADLSVTQEGSLNSLDSVRDDTCGIAPAPASD
jgi:hypothetical protein